MIQLSSRFFVLFIVLMFVTANTVLINQTLRSQKFNTNINTNGASIPMETTRFSDTSQSSSSGHPADFCLDGIRKRRVKLNQAYQLAESKFGKLHPTKSWAGKSGILSNKSDTFISIDCDLYQPSDERIIYFLHIHKAGGTSLCSSARANYYFANFEENCNAEAEGQCCGGDSIEAHRKFANETVFKFVGNEWPMFDTMDSANYRYVVQLRKSANRYKSHYKIDKEFAAKKKIFTFEEWLEVQPDNFSLRMLCGMQCLQRPKFQLTRQDFIYTLQRLEKFDNILLLEEQQTFHRFVSEVGWIMNPGVVNTEMTTKQQKKQQTNQSAMIVSSSYTALDDAVYEFSLALTQDKKAKSDTFTFTPDIQNALDNYFAAAPKEDCLTPCCKRCVFPFHWGHHLNKLMTNGITV